MSEETEVMDPLKEVEAMKGVAEALKGLKADSIQRVLSWASASFAVKITPTPKIGPSVRATSDSEDGAETRNADTQPSLADFFASASAETGPEKALIVGYWLQVVQGTEDFEGQPLNAELKHLGHGLSNVTSTLTSLMEQKPALIIQTKKTGKANQARKRYKLTSAGIARTKQMLGQEQTLPSDNAGDD
jgi:hypothetical protein